MFPARSRLFRLSVPLYAKLASRFRNRIFKDSGFEESIFTVFKSKTGCPGLFLLHCYLADLPKSQILQNEKWSDPTCDLTIFHSIYSIVLYPKREEAGRFQEKEELNRKQPASAETSRENKKTDDCSSVNLQMEQMRRIELPYQPWQGRVLPLNYICINGGPNGTRTRNPLRDREVR